MAKDKGLTKADEKKAYSLYSRALKLQGEIYDFRDRLEELHKEGLMQKASDAAFEMDTTWSNLEEVSKDIKQIVYKKIIQP